MFVKISGQSGFQSERVGTTWFRRVTQKDSCFSTGPLCSSECSKMILYGHHEKVETGIGTVDARVFDVYTTKVMDPMNHVYEGIVFCMEDKINISVFVS